MKPKFFSTWSGYYLVDGSYNENIAVFLEKAAEAGVKIVFDPGPLIGKVDKETIYRVLKIAHVLLPNETELETLEKMFVERKNFKEWCLKSGITYIITKKGREGAEILGENIFFDQPAFPVSSIDSTGAGDSFAGGLMAGMLMGLDLDEAVIMAAACGAITTTLVEPHGDFNLKDIERLVIEHREEEESYD
ncbi:MAG: carbohydrate kinase family protein [Anaerolineaceae bacterium]|nr:carbohydrate kinase family protein [Anaerolineaceae bacterium]